MCKLRGSSLVEAIVSMVIISFIFSIGLIIYLNVNSSLNSKQQSILTARAEFYLDSLSSLKQDLNFTDAEGFVVEIDFEPWNNMEIIHRMNCIVTDSIGGQASKSKIISFD